LLIVNNLSGSEQVARIEVPEEIGTVGQHLLTDESPLSIQSECLEIRLAPYQHLWLGQSGMKTVTKRKCSPVSKVA
jgi:hypothetical protein